MLQLTGDLYNQATEDNITLEIEPTETSIISTLETISSNDTLTKTEYGNTTETNHEVVTEEMDYNTTKTIDQGVTETSSQNNVTEIVGYGDMNNTTLRNVNDNNFTASTKAEVNTSYDLSTSVTPFVNEPRANTNSSI